MLDLIFVSVPHQSTARKVRADSFDMLLGGQWCAITAVVHQDGLPNSILDQGSGFLLEISLPNFTDTRNQNTLIPSGVQACLAESLHQGGYRPVSAATTRHQVQEGGSLQEPNMIRAKTAEYTCIFEQYT
jgi:hypothetical protein